MCLGSYSYWVAQSYADAQRTGDCNIGISRIISSSVDSCLALLSENVSPADVVMTGLNLFCFKPSQQLIDASVSCFRSFFTVVRPHYALSMQTVQNLYSRTCMTEDLPYTTEVSIVG